MSHRFAPIFATLLVIAAAIAVTIELLASRGWAGPFWLIATVSLLLGAYALRHYARATILYQRTGLRPRLSRRRYRSGSATRQRRRVGGR